MQVTGIIIIIQTEQNQIFLSRTGKKTEKEVEGHTHYKIYSYNYLFTQHVNLDFSQCFTDKKKERKRATKQKYIDTD